MNTIPDISRKSYDNRTFPILYVQEDITIRKVLYLKNEVISTYHYNYSRLIELIKENKINTQTILGIMKNAPLI